MRRLLTLAIASLLAAALSGCIIVPARHGGYYNDRGDHHDHGYRGDRGR